MSRAVVANQGEHCEWERDNSGKEENVQRIPVRDAKKFQFLNGRVSRETQLKFGHQSKNAQW
jgi:hypothetical protein